MQMPDQISPLPKTESVAVRGGVAITSLVRTDERILMSDIFDDQHGKSARPDLGSWQEPARNLPIYRETDVLVVGGGPSGTAAAVSAARLGAKVTLLERYNHLGGLSTGGLVIWIDRMTDWSGKLVIRGIAEELLDRMPPGSVAGPAPLEWGSTDTAKAAHWSMRWEKSVESVSWTSLNAPRGRHGLRIALSLTDG